MRSQEIYERLTPLFRDVLDNDGLVLSPELTADDVAEWDSLRHIRLVVGVEQELGVRFTAGEVDGLKSVGELVDLLVSKL